MAFHPHPQLIPRVFNPGGFGPPRDFTRASTWPWVDHLVSGLLHATVRRLRLAFATPTPNGLSLPRRVTRRLIMQKARSRSFPEGHRAPTACRLIGFRYYFTPLAGVLFTFPSRYWFTIGRLLVFSLGRWSSHVQTGFLVSRPTLDPPGVFQFSFTGLSPSMADLSMSFY